MLQKIRRSIKSSPKTLGKVTMSGVTHANFLAVATLTFCKESLRRPGRGGSQWGVGFKLSLALSLLSIYSILDSSHLFHTGPSGDPLPLEH